MKVFQSLVRELKLQGFSEQDALVEANQVDFGQLNDLSDATIKKVAKELFVESQIVFEALQ